jgi:NNP family nitrate/nitrite transporter-like MFS transporter
MLAVYIPLIVIVSICAALFMDNLATVRNDTGAAKEAVTDPQTSIMSLLYIGTFGSFIGFGFAFGLVLQNQFHRTPVQAAAVTFLGPLLGSLARPLGGWLSDRLGGSRVTVVNFALMALCAAVLIVAGDVKSLWLYTVGFIALFVFSGVGNGSTYKMIPNVFAARASGWIESGMDTAAARLRARRLAGALIGVAGAIGALGGVGVNLAFRQSFAAAKSGTPAVIGFLVFYAVCFVVTWLVYRPTARFTRI